jgi:hypothetical protein
MWAGGPINGTFFRWANKWYTYPLIEGTVTTGVLWSRNLREKDRIGESPSENEPYLFSIKFVPGGKRILD